MRILIKCMTAIVFMLFIAASVEAKTEYIDLKAGGNDMAPTINKGDTVRVQLRVNASLVNSGSATDCTGDIIVYAAAVTGNYGGMWACGRVIGKSLRGGHWYFNTKRDNVTEPDSWEIPDYSLLGVVIEISSNPSDLNGKSNTATSPESRPRVAADPRYGLPEFPELMFDFSAGIVLGSILGLAARGILSERKKIFTKIKTVLMGLFNVGSIIVNGLRLEANLENNMSKNMSERAR